MKKNERRIVIAHVTTADQALRYLMLNQLKSIQAEGYDVVGISGIPGRGEHLGVLKSANIPHVPVANLSRRFSPLEDLRALWQLYRIFRTKCFTIVHTHNPKPGLLGQLAARMARVPIVLNTLHGFYFHEHMTSATRTFYITLEKIAAKCSDVILSQNLEDIDTAIREGICQPPRISFLGNGIDVTRFDPNNIVCDAVQRKRAEMRLPEDVQVVGFVGRLAAKRKGFFDFLAAGQQIVKRMPKVRFLIVGDTDYGRPDAVSPVVAKEYGIWDHCLFLGWRSNEELPLLYALMDVLVLPSLFEGIPRTIMEASAMGVPVVASNVRGNREAVEHNRNGLLFPLSNVQALTDAIVKLLTDREKAQRMGEEGRRIALERFDEQHVFEKVKAEYRRLLIEKGLTI